MGLALVPVIASGETGGVGAVALGARISVACCQRCSPALWALALSNASMRSCLANVDSTG